MRFSNMRELQTAADMAGLEQEFLELRAAALRWEWLTRNASLGFDGSPVAALSWSGNNVIGDVKSIREVRRLVEFEAARKVHDSP